jgi:polyhydroxyalkanoate synthesis regulator protein
MYILRKYANRKLYDTHTHRYLALPDVLKLYKKVGAKLQVVDHKGQDITAEILLRAAMTMLETDTSFARYAISLASERVAS